jgi:hypothetical protein
MALKLSIAALLIIGGAVMIALSMNQKSELKLTVKGNDELGIKLELPYFKESPADVVITNKGDHYLLAYKIRWEGIKYSGEVVERNSIKYHPEALLEKDHEKRKQLLSSQPLLPPNTKWFVGLGRENRQITSKVPSLEEVGRDSQLFPDLMEYKELNVTLDAAMLENGQIVGRDTAAFDMEINNLVSEYLKFLKELNK